MAEKIKLAFESHTEHLYSGHNQKLSEIFYREPVATASFKGKLRRLVDEERFKIGSIWWRDSESIATITDKTSRSQLRQEAGEGSFRKIFWPKTVGNVLDGHTELGEIRVAVNYDKNGAQKSLELMARDREGKWQPFLFDRVGEHWYPAQERQGIPVTQVCARCHMEQGLLSPRPVQMKTAADYQREGYRDPGMIDHLLRSK